MAKQKDVQFAGDIVKVNKKLGLVIGYAIVCKNNGEDYYDLQGDHIPEDAMLKAATDFMSGQRTVGDMHINEDAGGQVVFAFPMTAEIAKSLGITVKKTGLLIAMKPSEEMFGKFESGEYTGFSIGGKRIEDEPVEDDE